MKKIMSLVQTQHYCVLFQLFKVWCEKQAMKAVGGCWLMIKLYTQHLHRIPTSVILEDKWQP